MNFIPSLAVNVFLNIRTIVHFLQFPPLPSQKNDYFEMYKRNVKADVLTKTNNEILSRIEIIIEAQNLPCVCIKSVK